MTEVVPQAAPVTPPPASNPWVPMWNLNPTSYDLRYNGDYLPGSYTDGDIVVFQGVAYLCVRPTGNAPVPWTPPQQVPTYGTALPANPVDGQEHVLVDSVTAPTWQWRLRYNAQSTSAYKWEFVGGTPYLQTATGQTFSAVSAWTPIVGWQVPRAGEYSVIPNISSPAPGGGAMTMYVGVGVQNTVQLNCGILSVPAGYWANVAGFEAVVAVPAAAQWVQTMGWQNIVSQAGSTNANLAVRPKRLA